MEGDEIRIVIQGQTESLSGYEGRAHFAEAMELIKVLAYSIFMPWKKNETNLL